MKRSIIVLALVITPSAVFAQVRPPVIGALVKKSIPRAQIAAMTGTSISTADTYAGIQCAESCVVAKAVKDDKSGVTVHFADGSVRVEEVRTGLVISHDKPHSLGLQLDTRPILGVQCDGHGSLKALPGFRAIGASSAGFKWAIFSGAKLLKSGHSDGDAVTWDGDGHTAGVMDVAVFDDGTLEISHGTSRLVMTTDDQNALKAPTGGLRFADLGLYVQGVSEFGLTSARIQGVNK
jgi:hypothetical protein